MLIKLSGGLVYDPIHSINGEQRDIYIQDGRIIRKPDRQLAIDKHYDLNGKVIMSGAIDIHTHIGGGKLNIARMMLPEDQQLCPIKQTKLKNMGGGHATPTSSTTGYRYAEMGYTACFEPAMLPINARQTHMEMADIPMIDKGAYAVLGNDDFFLRALSQKKGQEMINDYIAWTVNATKAIGVKVVNPGGISAFKFNQRQMSLDEKHPHYQITPRQILQSLVHSVREIGIAHPLHVHACNLGVPGNKQTTLETIQAAEGLPMHITHIQFHSYGTEGDKKFSSAAAEIAEAINMNQNISVDVGQIMFGQTVTISGDSMHQYAGHQYADPNKWMIMDIECDAGCGVVPFRYRDKNFVNALQWAIGLEIFLLVDDPWRIFLTTDHPNGAPFTSYPHLIKLLMDKSFRNDMLKNIHPDAQKYSCLSSIKREYSLYEIAIMTRAAPARSLGLKNRGHLGAGAIADITVYDNLKDREKMFSKPDLVFKDGHVIVKKGAIVKTLNGVTHAVKPEYDKHIKNQLKKYFDQYQTVSINNTVIQDEELLQYGNRDIIYHD